MKPHEETWVVHPLDSRCVIRPAGRVDEGLVMADIREPLHENGREVALLVAAAPEMARAILALRRPDGSCWCHHSRDIYEFGHDTVCGNTSRLLKRIGVLP